MTASTTSPSRLGDVTSKIMIGILFSVMFIGPVMDARRERTALKKVQQAHQTEIQGLTEKINQLITQNDDTYWEGAAHGACKNAEFNISSYESKGTQRVGAIAPFTDSFDVTQRTLCEDVLLTLVAKHSVLSKMDCRVGTDIGPLGPFSVSINCANPDEKVQGILMGGFLHHD